MPKLIKYINKPVKKPESELIITCENPKGLIVSFGGASQKFGGIQRFEFLNFLKKHFPNYDEHFYIESASNRYHKGIKGISSNIDETFYHIKKRVQSYKNITFIGVSAGAYAAILFGSLLNVTNVIAFEPPTICNADDPRKFDKRYANLKDVINNVTNYHLFGNLNIKDTKDCHHVLQCENIGHFPNVNIIKRNGFDYTAMRNSGELLTVFNNIIEF